MREDNPNWVELLEEGTRAWSQGNQMEAERALLLGLNRAEKAGAADTRIADSMDVLAAFYRSNGLYPLAERLYEQSLAMREKLLGGRHALVAKTLCALGHVYLEQSQHAKVKKVCRRAADIWERETRKQLPSRRRSARWTKMLASLPDENSLNGLAAWADELARQTALMSADVHRSAHTGNEALSAMPHESLADSLAQMSARLKTYASRTEPS